MNIKDTTSSVLIVGSAPTIKKYLKKIKQFDGEVWALNDSWFWLEKNSVQVDRAYFTDTRFIRKALEKIKQSKCNNLITIDQIELDLIRNLNKNINVFHSLGTIGCSLRYGEVFHGCSVFFTSIQTAIAMKYDEITVCGVLFPMPGQYTRIDGTQNFPEYVHNIQLKTARITLQRIREIGLKLKVLELNSNLNYL